MADQPMGEQMAVGKPVADLRAEPDPESELVNQALLNTPAVVGERRDGADGQPWAYVELPDYSGWMRLSDLAAEPGIDPAHGAATGTVRVVMARASVETGAGPLTLYAGTNLRLAGGIHEDTMEVLLPGGGRGLIAAADVRSISVPHSGSREETLQAVLATASEFLGTPYVWGGLTKEGIDCSGLTQTAYRVHGITIPRDANQQYDALTQAVAAGEWEPGDLIYLGPSPERITHVGIYAGEGKVLHAARPHVVLQSLDPDDPTYVARFKDEYQGSRRVIG